MKAKQCNICNRYDSVDKISDIFRTDIHGIPGLEFLKVELQWDNNTLIEVHVCSECFEELLERKHEWIPIVESD